MSFTSNASFAVLDKVASAGLRFVILFVIATALGPAGQGEYTFLLTFWSTCYVFSTFGLDTAANYFASKEPEALPTILGSMLCSVAALCCLVLLATVLGKQHTGYFDELQSAFPLLLVGLGAVFLGSTLKSTLYGRQEFRVIFFAGLLQHVLATAALGACYLWAELTMSRAIAIWLGGVLLNALVCLVRNLSLTGPRLAPSWALFRRLARYGRGVWLFTALNALNLRLDTFLIVYFLDLDDLGEYALAVAFMEITLYVPHALSRVILSEVSAEGPLDPALLPNVSGLTLLTLLGVAVASPLVMTLFFPEFLRSVGLFLILLPCGWLMGMVYSLGYVLLGKGHSDVPAKCAAAACGMTVVGNLALLPTLGVYGAALTTLVAYALAFGLILVAARRVVPVSLAPRFGWAARGLQALRRRGREEA